MTLPPSLCTAAVNEHWVLVLGSKNISATTLPLSIWVKFFSLTIMCQIEQFVHEIFAQVVHILRLEHLHWLGAFAKITLTKIVSGMGVRKGTAFNRRLGNIYFFGHS
ncbi:hypothetical protein BpHYR1_033881 [Brachionus plicatilis]|uniref:Uncharacterized protein n=1 Tax=Brachionus plicatilis TaxID=10195 RepID=A0A3M7S6N4_BRAPC|nr:hypothetical protein BpHYR1_033881 [Brachionus plicatilis]